MLAHNQGMLIEPFNGRNAPKFQLASEHLAVGVSDQYGRILFMNLDFLQTQKQMT